MGVAISLAVCIDIEPCVLICVLTLVCFPLEGAVRVGTNQAPQQCFFGSCQSHLSVLSIFGLV